jgi:hypothetical protein
MPFDIRAYVREQNLRLPIDDPAVRADVLRLLRRDLSERLPTYVERWQRNQDRTGRQNPDAPEYADAGPA